MFNELGKVVSVGFYAYVVTGDSGVNPHLASSAAPFPAKDVVFGNDVTCLAYLYIKDHSFGNATFYVDRTDVPHCLQSLF